MTAEVTSHSSARLAQATPRSTSSGLCISHRQAASEPSQSALSPVSNQLEHQRASKTAALPANTYFCRRYTKALVCTSLFRSLDWFSDQCALATTAYSRSAHSSMCRMHHLACPQCLSNLLLAQRCGNLVQRRTAFEATQPPSFNCAGQAQASQKGNASNASKASREEERQWSKDGFAWKPEYTDCPFFALEPGVVRGRKKERGREEGDGNGVAEITTICLACGKRMFRFA